MAAAVEGVQDVAAVGVPNAGGGPENLAIFCVYSGTASVSDLRASFSAAIKQRLNPLFKVRV